MRVVRDFETADMDAVLAIWLDASLQAHPFVYPTFWHGQLVKMRERYIPGSHTRVIVHDHVCAGFSRVHGSMLAALFVSPAHQGNGLGALLVEDVKEGRDSLELAVYVRNSRAVRLYERQAFRASQRRTDPHRRGRMGHALGALRALPATYPAFGAPNAGVEIKP